MRALITTRDLTRLLGKTTATINNWAKKHPEIAAARFERGYWRAPDLINARIITAEQVASLDQPQVAPHA